MSKYVIIISIVIVLIIIVATSLQFGYERSGKKNEEENDMFAGVDERTDIEPLQTRFKWLDIKSCIWKSTTIEHSESFPPNSTDVIACGYLTLDQDYMINIQSKYTWYKNNSIDLPFFPQAIEKDNIVLYSSADYKQDYTAFLDGYSVEFYFDFDMQIVFFSGTLR